MELSHWLVVTAGVARTIQMGVPGLVVEGHVLGTLILTRHSHSPVVVLYSDYGGRVACYLPVPLKCSGLQIDIAPLSLQQCDSKPVAFQLASDQQSCVLLSYPFVCFFVIISCLISVLTWKPVWFETT